MGEVVPLMLCGVFVLVFLVVVAVVVVYWWCVCVCSWCSCGLPMLFFIPHVRQDELEYDP